MRAASSSPSPAPASSAPSAAAARPARPLLPGMPLLLAPLLNTAMLGPARQRGGHAHVWRGTDRTGMRARVHPDGPPAACLCVLAWLGCCAPAAPLPCCGWAAWRPGGAWDAWAWPPPCTPAGAAAALLRLNPSTSLRWKRTPAVRRLKASIQAAQKPPLHHPPRACCCCCAPATAALHSDALLRSLRGHTQTP